MNTTIWNLNLALQGGGSHGAFTWGVLDRFLDDDRLAVEGISGVSSGALNPFDLNPLRDVLAELVDFRKLQEDCPIKLFVGATQVKTGKLRIFTNRELTADVLLATTCLPSIHHAVEIDGEYYWDGGYSGNPPVFPLIFNCGNPDVVVVLLYPLRREALPFTADEIHQRTSELSFNNTFLREMRAIAFSKDQIRRDWLRAGNLEKKLDRLNLHLIEDSGFSQLDSRSRYNAGAEFIQTLYQRGYQAADRWLDENYRHISQSSSVDLAALFC